MSSEKKNTDGIETYEDEDWDDDGEEVSSDEDKENVEANTTQNVLAPIKVSFDVSQCIGDKLYTYLPKWLDGFTNAEIATATITPQAFEAAVQQSHLEANMLNTIEKMALKENRLYTKDDFEYGKPLGKGAFGQVYLARLKKTKFICAIKMLHKSKINEYRMAEQVKIETESGFKLHHPLILTMYDVFQDESKFYFVLEYAPHGQLYRFLQKVTRFPERLAATYIYQVSHALQYCHRQNIIHRDLKPENILLDCCGNLKVADFGWSTKIRNKDTMNTTACGTLDYLAPEIVSHQEYQYNVDNWCVGVLTFELLTGGAPFADSEDSVTKAKITKGEYKVPDYVSSVAKGFLAKLLQKDPRGRMSLLDCIQHNWLKTNAYKYMFGPYKCPVYC